MGSKRKTKFELKLISIKGKQGWKFHLTVKFVLIALF